METQIKKTCLIISYGPVPTKHSQIVEGGGMRAWGLAKGLQSSGVDVTVGINISFPLPENTQDDISLINWELNDDFVKLINSFDSVIISYCMGDPSVFVAENINDNALLILDAYVPIYIEVAARDAKDMPNEYLAFSRDISNHNKVLKRGDYFLCANEAQKIYYTGVLGSLGVMNPYSYRKNRIKIVPFGIHRNEKKVSYDPYEKLGIPKNQKRVLWFGGLYPWFRVDELLEAIKELAKDPEFNFIFVGAKNPFNNNPDLLRQAEYAESFAKKNKLFNKNVFFVDWVEFNDRFNWYEYADFVISLNQPGEENQFSWRTRVMDYISGDLAIVTNGGDPLSEELVEKHSAIKLSSTSKDHIVATIREIYKDKSILNTSKENLKLIKKKYYWDIICNDLSRLINNVFRPYLDEREFLEKSSLLVKNFNDGALTQNILESRAPHKKIMSLARKAKNKGIKKSIKLGSVIIKNQVKRKLLPEKQFIFISHPIDNTGAPLVLLQIIDEFIEIYGPRKIRLLTPYIDEKIYSRLKSKRIKIEKTAQLSYSLTAAQLSINQGDFVLMNTIAVYDNYREVVLNMAKLGRIKANWFIHEDEAQLENIKPVIKETKYINKVNELLESEKLNIYVPSKRVKDYYDELFKTSKVKTVPLKINLPSKLINKNLTPKNYKKINFLISGTPSDGRKGQLIAIAAFQRFKLKYFDHNPELYRDFSLSLVSIRDDYISSQIKSIGKSVLGKRLVIYPPLPMSDALDITSRCNAVMCCSLNETFGLYIAEGMLMGHVVFRNDSAGIDEQLKDGFNGYYIDSENIEQISDQIEKALNKNKTSDKDLYKMGQNSIKMMEPYLKNSYQTHFIK